MTEGKWMILGGVAAILFVAFYVIFYAGSENGKEKIGNSSSPEAMVVKELVRGVEASGKTGTMTTKAAEKKETAAVAEVAEQQKTEPAPTAINKDPSFDPAREKEEVSKMINDLKRNPEDIDNSNLKVIMTQNSKMKIVKIETGGSGEVMSRVCDKDDFCEIFKVNLNRNEDGWRISDIQKTEKNNGLNPLSEDVIRFPAKITEKLFKMIQEGSDIDDLIERDRTAMNAVVMINKTREYLAFEKVEILDEKVSQIQIAEVILSDNDGSIERYLITFKQNQDKGGWVVAGTSKYLGKDNWSWN